MTTKQEAIAKTKILLGEVAAASTRNNEQLDQFIETLKAMRDTVEQAIVTCRLSEP